MSSWRVLGVLLALLGAGMAFAWFAPTVLGATGDLTPAGCVDDDDFEEDMDPMQGEDTCGITTDGLHNASSAAVSPDGTSLYAISFEDHAVVHFQRNTLTGALTPVGCFGDDESGPETACTDTDALAGAISVAVSPDGLSVYVASATDDGVVRFNRNPGTGVLTPMGCLVDNDTGTEIGCSNTNGLGDARSVAVSPDGESIYVAAGTDAAILIIDRDTSTGAFEDNSCIGPLDGCTSTGANLNGPISLALSPDGRFLYVAGNVSNTVTYFERDVDASDGSVGDLEHRSCVADEDPSPLACGGSTTPGLTGPRSVAVSADGLSVYAASEGDDAVVRLDRTPSNGSIEPAGCFEDTTGPDDCGMGNSTPGLDNAASVAVSPDGRSVYAASEVDQAIVNFDRDPATGALMPSGCVDDDDTGPDDCGQTTNALNGARYVALSPDGGSLYAATSVDDAVVHFNREPLPAPPPPPGGVTASPTPTPAATGLRATALKKCKKKRKAKARKKCRKKARKLPV